jgi:hypothetical protein
MRAAYAFPMADQTTKTRPAHREAAEQLPDALAQEEARAFLLEVAARTGLKMNALARGAGLAQSTLARPLTDRGAKWTARTIRRIADTYRIAPPPSLLDKLPEGVGRMHDTGVGLTMEHRERAPRARTPPPERDVPIYAAHMVQQGPLWRRNTLAVDTAPRPAGIITARQVYALRCPDETMAPRWRAGDLIYIDPARPVRAGDHALIEMLDPTLPDEDSVYVLRLVTGPATACYGKQATAYAPTRTEEDLADLKVHARWRVLELADLIGA